MNEIIKECSKYNNSIHNHTDASLGDGVTKPEQLVARAKELGATAIGITDHGNCANWLDFYNAAKEAGIKPVLGVEAYVANPSGDRYNHLLVAAKNYTGVQDISRFVSATNRNLKQRRNGDEIPVAEEWMFKLIATGNVIVTSACIAGPVADPLMDWTRVEREIAKVQRRLDKVTMPKGFEEAQKINDDVLEKIDTCNKRIKELRPKTKVPSFKRTQTKINKMEDSAEKTALQESLNKEILEAEESAKNAAAEIDSLKATVSALKNNEAYVSAKKVVAKIKDIQKKQKVHLDKIDELEKSKRPETDIISDAKAIAKRYKKIFEDDFYMEVQYHGIPAETFVYPAEAKIAKELGIKLIAANDSHVPSEEYIEVRTMLQNAKYITKAKVWKDAQVGDDQLYIKSGEELAQSLLEILEPEDVLEAMRNMNEVADNTNIVWSDAKHYPHFDNAKELLRKKTLEGISKRYPDGFPEEYRKRMEYELEIIDKMGYNDYFCEVIDFIQFAKKSADNSIEIGPGRGSGAGSIVCYLTYISEVDPMKYGLMFERFLNPERVSMPDIDTDFSKHARKISIAHVKEKYGEESVAGIMTKAKMAAKAALDYAGKLWGLITGCEKTKFAPLVKEMKSFLPDNPQVSLKKNHDCIESQYSDNEDAKEILRRALLLEGLTTSFGTHAAGIIIGDGAPLENYIPLMSTVDDDGNRSVVIQADMVQAEAQLGFIKMDFLGLKNLNVLTACMRMITKNYGIKIDPYNLPIEKEVIEHMFQKGYTNYVFQFESDGMKKMLRDFKPTCFEDLILLVACYRPGPMQYLTDEGDSVNVIKVKNGITPVKYLMPELEPILKDTYGGIIYQEQVIQICQQLAGFSMAQADNVRRYMSKKKIEKLAHERKAFVYGDPERNIPGCVKKLGGENASEVRKEEIAEKADQLFSELEEFAKYAFNKAHATCYALIAYMTAYFKYHYFKEYVCAAMTEQGDKKAQLVEDCSAENVKIYRPDVNESDVDFRTYKNGIIFGLSNIKQLDKASVAIVEERKNGVYTSIENFIERTNADVRVIEALCLSGSFDSFCRDRKEALVYAKSYKESYNNLKNAENDLENAEKDGSSKPLLIATCKNTVSVMRENLQSVKHDNSIQQNTTDKLSGEMEFLGMWLTGNPLDDYDTNGYETASADEGQRRVAGVVTNFKKLARKSDGAAMGKFTFVDKNSDTIEAIAFTKTYAKYKDLLKDDNAVVVSGKIEADDEGRKQIVVENVSVLKKKEESILFSVNDFVEKATLYNMMKGYEDENGLNCIIFNVLSNEMQTTKFKVNREIMNRKNVHSKLIAV